MAEVVLDGANTEASATIDFPAGPADGDFYCAPYNIDGACHISGFIVNASDLLDSEQNVYVSHGWGAMKFSRPLVAGMKLRNYVRMMPQPNNISKGDVYIMEGDEIVAVCEGIKFQQILRKVLNIFLPPNKGSTAQTMPVPVAQKSVPARASTAAPTKRTIAPAPDRKVATPVKVAPSMPKPSKVTAKKPSGTMVDKIMTILSKETEVDIAELVDDAHFENLGVDSLLSLTISAIFREDLSMEISPSLFTDYPTVGEMKKYFSQFGVASSIDSEDDSDTDSLATTDVATPFDEMSTPASSAPSVAPSEAGKPDFGSPPRESLSEVADVSIARHIIAQEMGVDIAEVTDDAELAEMGMDSLMSLTILGELREKTGIDLPGTFLMTNPTLVDIENALGMRPKPKAVGPKLTKATTTTDLNEVSARLTTINKTDISQYPSATSVLLQGNPKVATKKVFFLPDGSGSATSYVSIPNIGPHVAAFGLNCPFMKDPEQWQCGIEVSSLIYLAEIRRRQPKGPYIIGGWSAGGVIAYAVAQALLAAGEKVEKLLLLDSPCPVNLAPLPTRLHVFFNEIGLLGTGDPAKTPKWLLPHFSAAIRSLSAYDPKPTIAPLPTYAVWCKDGVAGNPGDPRPPPAEEEDPAPMKWLLDHRTDFSDNGWAQLCGTNMKFGVMGGHHVSLPPHFTRCNEC
jgi:acyl carrier protein/pimeloyl-ACP methyl ester carboxylesterase